MNLDMFDPRIRCRVQPGRSGETRVIFDIPTEPAYIALVMTAITNLAMNRFAPISTPTPDNEPDKQVSLQDQVQ